MIFRMKHIIITFFLFVSISTIGNGQNTMRLDEYSISSSQLDSIINMVLCDVGDKDYINVSAERNESIPAIVVITVKNNAQPESRIPITTDSLRCPVLRKYILKLFM